MASTADLERALERATIAYKEVCAERDRLRAALDREMAYRMEVAHPAVERAINAEAERDRLREALKGLVGLVQLVRSRDDCPIAIKQVLTDQYRLDDALAALKA